MSDEPEVNQSINPLARTGADLQEQRIRADKSRIARRAARARSDDRDASLSGSVVSELFDGGSVPVAREGRDSDAFQDFASVKIKRRREGHGFSIAFALFVVVPTIVSGIYYYLYASPQFTSEFRFSVQDASAPTTLQSNNILSSLGLSGGPDNTNNYLVIDFLTSDEVLRDLERRIQVKERYSRPEIDWISRFNSAKSLERFLPYWQKRISASYDQVTGLATVTVYAFSAQDAFVIAQTLEKVSEDLINEVANRPPITAVRFAENEVTRAENRLKSVRGKWRKYRNKVGVLDPNTSITVANSQLVQSLQANLSGYETQLSTLQSLHLAPNAPAVITLKSQIEATKDQLKKTESSVSGTSNHFSDPSALSDVVSEYEQLNLEVQYAQAQVTSTQQALDLARANAAAQHLYITPYVKPQLATSSIYPDRTLSTVEVFLIAFGIWLAGLLILRSIRERFA
jgi:capsular polysaccharide transport system permease protein